jgi:hypothetical protein
MTEDTLVPWQTLINMVGLGLIAALVAVLLIMWLW